MSEKKRKRSSEHGEKPRKKKSSTESSSGSATQLKISHLSRQDAADSPVIAATVGFAFPEDISMQAYKSNAKHPELLLHSQEHPQLNYTARERGDAAEATLNHYLATFDPQSGEVKVLQVPKLLIKTSLRKEDNHAQALRAVQSKYEGLTNRGLLGMEFGTKKQQRRLKQMVQNKIETGKETNASEAAHQDAVLESMRAAADQAQTEAQKQEQMDSGKPRPPRSDSENPKDIYNPDLIVGRELLQMVRVKPWVEIVEGKSSETEIMSQSRFVAHRAVGLAKDKNFDVKKLKTLRYLEHLIKFYQKLKPARDGGRRLLPKEQLEKDMNAEPGVLEAIKLRFTTTGGGEVSKWHVDKLIMHICALTLVCDDAVTDTHDIMMDLSLKLPELTTYFAECGVKLSAMSEPEQAKMGLSKGEASMHRIAKVRVPLVFPKVSRGKRKNMQ